MHVDGYFGDTVLTNAGLASFITSFETMIESYGKTVINSTQGGAKIKGTVQMSLKRAIKKYCKDKIDKSVLTPFLKPIDDQDSLIEKVIPKLKQDLSYLHDIIKYSKLGISSGKKILKAKEDSYLKKEMAKNEKYSNKAHELAKKLPLVILSIFNESKTIQQRELWVDGGTEYLLKNKDDLKIRVQRNRLILEAALNSSKSLLKNYKTTIKTLEENKNNHFVPEKTSLDDAEEYFKNENFAHPYIDAKKIIQKESEGSDLYKKATKIIKKAINLRLKLDLPVDHDEEDRLLMYNDLIEEASKIGRENKDFDRALKLIKYALWIMPNGTKAKWGKATILGRIGRFDESINLYKELLEIDPDNFTYQFELALIYGKNNQERKCIELLTHVMINTDDYDHWLGELGTLQLNIGDKEAAKTCYELYLEKYPGDKDIWKKLHEIDPSATKGYEWLID
jgi:tetratricopeptide (TPR) repeat protein